MSLTARINFLRAQGLPQASGAVVAFPAPLARCTRCPNTVQPGQRTLCRDCRAKYMRGWRRDQRAKADAFAAREVISGLLGEAA